LNPIVEKPVLRVTDIEHFHWSLSEADLPESTALNKPVSLAAAVELALIEAHYRTLGLSSRKFNFAPQCSVYSTIKSANWPSSKKANSKQTGDIVVIVLPGADSNSWWIEQLQLLKGKLTDKLFPPKLATALTGGVAEMVDNAWLHSASDQPALLAYQVRNRRFAFSVADMGIGILRSLKQNPKYDWLQSSKEAIEFAVRPGVSRLDGGGMGFTTMLKSMVDIWGNARVRTGQASLLIDGTQEVRTNNFIYLPHLPGLHVSVRCSLETIRNSSR
jgi:anti-sigma regulatory factor (Ser/Thr protein kinase)